MEREVLELKVDEFEKILSKVVRGTLGMQLDQLAGQIQGLQEQLKQLMEEGRISILREFIFPVVDYLDVALNKQERPGSEWRKLESVDGILARFAPQWNQHMNRAKEALESIEIEKFRTGIEEVIKEFEELSNVANSILKACEDVKVERLPVVRLDDFATRVSRLTSMGKELIDWIMGWCHNPDQASPVPEKLDLLHRLLNYFLSHFQREFSALSEQVRHQRRRIQDVLEEIRRLRQSIIEFLGRYGVQEIEAKTGMDFDSSLHTVVETERGKTLKAGQIIRCVRAGFKYNERVLRVAEVVVAS
ncbi:MAG: nucleotide exchange factor GrpE [Thermoproteota archaeon]|nr:MAG: nucleotide exchange factor GrpE [Candidatus Korarchaeota archaeon]